MDDYLTERLGSGWKAKFEEQVDSLFRLHRTDTIRKTVLADPEVLKLANYLASQSHGQRHLYVDVSTSNTGVHNVRVCEAMGDSVVAIYQYYKVDPYTLAMGRVQY
jgi:hypothetical protein